MLTPNELEFIPDGISKIYRGLQLDILNDIVSRIAVNREITRTADWEITRLYELGVAKEVIKRTIKRALRLTESEIDRIYNDVLAEDYARYEPIYRQLGQSFVPYRENKQLKQLVKGVKAQTLGEFKNITRSLGFAIKQLDGSAVFMPLSKAYQKTLDKAAFGMLSGAFDYNTMLKKAVRELTASGLRSVDYFTEQGDGNTKIHSNRVEVAARRALMTGFNQTVAKITEENAEKLGTDKFEVTYHRGARPTHQPWQGRVYSKAELVSVCGYGEVDGLKGANCYHDFHPFIEGISKRLYTDEQLDEWNKEENTPKQYGSKEYTVYEAQQRQRRLETSLRRKREEIELLEKGGASEDDILAAKAKYHAISGEYSKFSKAMKLPQQRERISIDGRKGVDVSIGKPKTYTESGISGKRLHNTSENKVDLEYIKSREYHDKFKTITNNQAVNEQIYKQSKAFLTHRNGTNYENICLIDNKTGRIVALQNDSQNDFDVGDYNKKMKDAIKNNPPYSLISLHNHPTNNPPTGSDIVSNGSNKYQLSVVVTHNGKVFSYKAGNKPFTAYSFGMRVDKYRGNKYNLSEYEAIIQTLKDYTEQYGIEWREFV